MKGLIRGGIRYISHMFDEKEPEFEIGLPTDVKHVAHIGWEGPDASKPSWMDGFHTKSAPELVDRISDSLEEVPRIAPISTDESQGEKPKHRGRRSSTNSPMNSPGRKSTEGAKHSKISTESPKNRRYRHMLSPKHSPSRDQAAIPKHSRPRKTKKDKNSTKDGPEGSETKSKQAKKSYASHLSSVLEAYEDEKPTQQTDNSPDSKGMMMVENSEFQIAEAKTKPVGIFVN